MQVIFDVYLEISYLIIKINLFSWKHKNCMSNVRFVDFKFSNQFDLFPDEKKNKSPQNPMSFQCTSFNDRIELNEMISSIVGIKQIWVITCWNVATCIALMIKLQILS